MKTNGTRVIAALAVLTVFGIFPFTSAANPPFDQEIKEAQGESVWPPPSAFEWYWHRPDDSLSQPRIDASLAVIKSGMFMMAANDSKGPLTGVAVSKRRIQFNWLRGGSPTQSYFPPKILGSMRLYYATSQPQGQKWLVVVNLTTQGIVQVYFEAEAQARAFIDAAASIAKAAGVALEDKEKRGFAVSDLSPAQAQVLGKSRVDSALVTMIAYGGPAEQAGLRFLDLITEADGVKVRNADHLVSLLDSAAPGTVLNLTCLERVEVTESGASTRVWKPRTVVWKAEAE